MNTRECSGGSLDKYSRSCRPIINSASTGTDGVGTIIYQLVGSQVSQRSQVLKIEPTTTIPGLSSG